MHRELCYTITVLDIFEVGLLMEPCDAQLVHCEIIINKELRSIHSLSARDFPIDPPLSQLHGHHRPTVGVL